MTAVMLAFLVIGLLAGVYAILMAVRRHRTPPELRGDWWTPFEREFRAYARQASARGRQPRHHRGEHA